jgi:preprotein translocase subunit SecG
MTALLITLGAAWFVVKVVLLARSKEIDLG